MFDISFSELLLIGVVALLVLGPERLPKVAKMVGYFIGRFQRYFAQTKIEMMRQIPVESFQELEQQLREKTHFQSEIAHSQSNQKINLSNGKKSES